MSISKEISDIIRYRDQSIYKSFQEGMRQKTLGKLHGLSESRIKAICKEQKRKKNGSQ